MKLQRRHLLAGSAVTLAAALVGLGAFALLGGLDRNVVERVHGGGTRVVRVALVDAVVGFDVTPDEVVVERGAHVVLDVVNEGAEAHDLAVLGGVRTRRLAPVSRNGSTSARSGAACPSSTARSPATGSPA
jgi:hypothetical protein